MNTISEDDWAKICLNVADQMSTYTRDYIASVSIEVSPTEGRLVGSGTYLELHGQPYILTNEHVAREQLKGSLAHQLKNGEYAFQITNPFQTLSYPVDAAIVRIEKEHFAQGERRAIPSTKIKERFVTANQELLCIHGFPSEKSRMSAFVGGLLSRSIAYSTQEINLPKSYDPAYFFAIHYPYDQRLMTTEDKRDYLPNPHGLSGSTVWDTGYVAKKGINWKPEDASIVGLIRAWDQNHHSLIGIKIEVVRQFLVKAIREEAAYFHWLGRECPKGDDWADWFFSENMINDVTMEGDAIHASI
jgi:hypothetical protein